MSTLTRETLSRIKADEFANEKPEVPGDFIIGTVLEYDLALETQHGKKLRISIRADEGQSGGEKVEPGAVLQCWEKTQLRRALVSRDIQVKDKIGIDFQRLEGKTKIFAVQVIPNVEARKQDELNNASIEMRIRDAAARETRLKEERNSQVELTSDIELKLGDDEVSESMGGIE